MVRSFLRQIIKYSPKYAGRALIKPICILSGQKYAMFAQTILHPSCLEQAIICQILGVSLACPHILANENLFINKNLTEL